MRIILVATALGLSLTFAACGGGDSKASPTTAATSPRPATAVTSPATGATAAASTTARTAPAATPASSAEAPTPPPDGAVVDVTGIVGGVNLAGNTLEIKRLSGVPVTQVTIDGRTIIRKAGGGNMKFSEIRISDRIIARGILNDRRDALLASAITVSDVVPGAAPGG